MKVSCFAAAIIAAAALGTSANAQNVERRVAPAALQKQILENRSVGVTGKMRNVRWKTGAERDVYQMRLLNTARRMDSMAGVRSGEKVWTARADICSTPGEEILMQIRSPLTCGTLGCEMLILSDVSGRPEVLMRTIGDTIDAPAMDEIIINHSSTNNRQRSWRYDRGGRFRTMDRR